MKNEQSGIKQKKCKNHLTRVNLENNLIQSDAMNVKSQLSYFNTGALGINEQLFCSFYIEGCGIQEVNFSFSLSTFIFPFYFS